MLKTHSSYLSKLDRTIDLLLTVGSFFLAYALSRGLSPYFFVEQFGGLDTYIWMLYMIVPVWAVRLPSYQLYGSLRNATLYRLISTIGKAILEVGVISGAVIFLLKQQTFSRGFFLVFLFTNFFTLVVWKAVVRQVLWTLRKRGYNYRQILIIGDNNKATKSVKAIIDEKKEWGLRVLGVMNLIDEQQQIAGSIDGEAFQGDSRSFQDLLSNNVIDEIFITSFHTNSKIMEEIIRASEELGIQVRIILDFFSSNIFKKADINKLGSHYALTLNTTNLDTDTAIIKRTMDIALASFGIIVTAIVSIPIAILIKCTSKGPVFFRQTRVGQNGRSFHIYKFRTMVTDAEQRKQDLLEKNEMNGVMFKMEDDPRLTPCGKFLRKFSLDELPQLYNVLRGEMSLVGPRPPTPDEVCQYAPWQRRRLSVRPGLSGFWQVSGRNNIQDFDDVVRKDLEYIDRWSLWLDIKILFKTVIVVLYPQGAK